MQEEGETFLAGGVEMTSWGEREGKRTASSRISTSRDESEGHSRRREQCKERLRGNAVWLVGKIHALSEKDKTGMEG